MTASGEIGGRNHFTDFDLDAPEFSHNFSEVVTEIHQGCPMDRNRSQGGYWMVSGLEDVRAITQDWRIWTNTEGYQPSRLNDDDARLCPLDIDSPYQTRWRLHLGEYFQFEDVAKAAGVADAGLITEPAAAAHYASSRQLREGEIVAVYDLGGGTFDATVLRSRPACVAILRTWTIGPSALGV